MKQTKLIFGKSLNFLQHDKSEYLERRVRYFKAFGINASHANIIRMDFNMTVFEWLKKPLSKRERLYLYKRRGSYANNREI